MPYYRCSIVTTSGKKSSIIKEASSEQELISSFNNTEHILIKYSHINEAAILRSKKNYNRNIVLEFTEIMTSLLKSGLTIQDAISMCCTVTANSKTEWLSKSILRALQNGLPLHEALKMHAPSFSPLYQSLVKLGEQTGSVAAVFQRLSMYLRNEKKIRGKVGNVLWYPVIILCVALGGSIGIITFILPRMAEIFEAFVAGSDQETVMEMARVYRSVWVTFSVFLFIAASAVGAVFFRKFSAKFAYLTDYLLIRIPFFSGYIKSIQTMDFSFAMEMLTGAGINVHTALKETSSVVRNRAYARAISEVHTILLKGEQLSDAFSLFKEFPPYISTWIAVGERTGAVEPVFSQIREYFQSDVERMSERLMNLLEPCIILIVGILVLLMIVQFALPLFSLYGRLV
ncbi:MAG: type II secretion system F family protein [Treponema sp.]|jgi:type II secretory pathway component PulF|nr:type II secretion system F family protein [Treponema sp.]